MWRINQGTIVGPHHEKRGEESQDFCSSHIMNTPNGDVAVIVATDGAGSLELSGQGAEFIAEYIVRYVTDVVENSNSFTEDTMHAAFMAAREALMELEDYKVMGCTVAAAVLFSDSWVIGVLGDAFAVVHISSQEHVFYQPKGDSEYANVTELITSKNVHPIFMSGNGEVYGVSVSSDGLQHMSIQNDEPVDGFWSNLLKYMSNDGFATNDFLSYLKTKDRLDDDTTLVTCLRTGVTDNE